MLIKKKKKTPQAVETSAQAKNQRVRPRLKHSCCETRPHTLQGKWSSACLASGVSAEGHWRTLLPVLPARLSGTLRNPCTDTSSQPPQRGCPASLLPAAR